ncbi:jg16667 [Pararge aegeria aegeria]|uniref:Jg16667 protein n=1 Tax=Pararge aegeria aegeria TaxID=348720 RepID=A0A8S4REK9_9NEOP|nr:jg16667 [Pararge aegeria aegeria]
MEEDERRLSFPPPAPLNSPGEEIDGSRLLGEIVRTLEATNPEAAAPLVASQSRDALDAPEEKPKREELRIALDVTFSESVGRSDGEPRAVVTPFTRESAKRAGSRGAQLVREFGFMPRRRLSVEDGARLPRKFEPFPPKLYGRPLEEIDNFIYDEGKKPGFFHQFKIKVRSRRRTDKLKVVLDFLVYSALHSVNNRKRLQRSSVMKDRLKKQK